MTISRFFGASMLVVISACATSSTEDSTTATGLAPAVAAMDVSLAQSCDEVADIVTVAAQQALDAIGSRGVDDEPLGEASEDSPDLFELTAEAFDRTDLPDCDMESLEWLLCDRNQELLAHGPAGEEFKEFWYAPEHCQESLSPRDS